VVFIVYDLKVYLVPVPWMSKSFGNFTWQAFDDNDDVSAASADYLSTEKVK